MQADGSSPSGLRVLGRLRLSRSTEESTSIARQREVIQQWASHNGHAVVGWAEDVDVSGSVDPFDTPALGEWLNNRPQDFDVVATWKLDRLGRDSIRLNKLFGWAIDHGKTIVSCTEGIDLSTPVGRMIANVIAFLAEGELEAIRERVRSSKAKLRQVGRWGGGKPPFGYWPEKGGEGWVLVVDPDAEKVVRRIVDDFLGGKGVGVIARELNSEGVPTPLQYHAAKRGNPIPEGKWEATPVKNMLRSKALRGFAHHQGETVRDDQGLPVRIAPALVDPDEWELIQARLDAVQEDRKNIHRPEASPLAGLVTCIECGAKAYHSRESVKRMNKRYDYRYYRCEERCSSSIPADELESMAEESFLAEVGDVEVRERVWVPGDSREVELREALAAVDELLAAAGRAKSATMKARLQKQLDSLDDRIAVLESAPSNEAHWEWHSTGVTYGEVWASSDTAGRRELLRRSGITIAASVKGRSKSSGGAWKFHINVPEEAIAMGGPIDAAAIEKRIEEREASAAAERKNRGIADY